MKPKLVQRALIPLFLIGLNLFLIWPWFQDGFAPHAASIEPTVIAQARFIKNNWPNTAWNPHWYLGFPFRFAGSPVLPYLTALTNTFFPKTSLWLAYRIITGLGLVIMSMGIYWLAHSLAPALVFSLLPSFLFLFPQVAKTGRNYGLFPWQYFSLAYLGNGPKTLGLAVLPFTLLSIDQFLKAKVKRPFLPVFLICLLALIDLSLITSLMILVTLLLVSYAMVRKLGQKHQDSLLLFIFSLLILSFYYTPRFWFQILSAPSLGGKKAFSVAFFLARFFSILVPMVLAVVSSRFLKKKKDQAFLFFFLWIFVFAGLTLARFLADCDFWQDYTSWGVELGIGIALLTGHLLTKKLQVNSQLKSIALISVILLSSLIWFGKRNLLLTPRRDISKTVEYRVIQWLETNTASDERVYLSGSPVFWLNSLVDLAQVRGGADKGANHPWWNHASYQIRIGEDPKLAYEWLKAMGASSIIVHGDRSEEPYRDFYYPKKFEDHDQFLKITEEKDDTLYQVKAGITREIKNPDDFLKASPPINGADQEALANYNSFLGSLVPFEWLSSSELVINSPNSQALSLAITFDSGWQAWQSDQKLKIKKDSLGQIVVFPKNQTKIKLKYQFSSLDQAVGFLLAFLGVFKLLTFSPKKKQ